MSGRHGEWRTQSTAIVVDRQSGIARAVHAGTSTVKYNVSTDCITHTDVSLPSDLLLVLLMTQTGKVYINLLAAYVKCLHTGSGTCVMYSVMTAEHRNVVTLCYSQIYILLTLLLCL